MDISNALSVINSLIDMSKMIKDGNIDTEVKKKAMVLTDSIIVLQQTILTLQSEVHELRESNRHLKEQLIEISEWEKEASRYEMKALCEGVEVYALKMDQEPSEPYHYICPNCYKKRRNSIIQKTKQTLAGTHYQCMERDCMSEFVNHDDRPRVGL